jgi:hypothetical protein
MLRRTAYGWLTAAALGLAVAGPAASADDVLSGTVSIESTSVALGVGVTWGDGVLTYNGQTYPFTINGLSVVDLGIASITAAGEVYGLTKLEDFEGNYVAGEAGAVVGGGGSVVHMENQNGVTIKLNTTQTGAKLTLAAEGVDIDLK